MNRCANCRQPITDKVWRIYVTETGDDTEPVHKHCEADYEAARDQRAGQKAIAPPARAKTAQPTPV